ncbi:hypothetical protein JKA74_19990 [Marivirga sp. S37H4]|uniref:NERD domain-containing protein n=1 Tax=Marivirga aurantiaca TaxID=2802615 RepID=A0A934X269_9BACT|nr:hypothetical protein [Marivirga aurantiaca]MBK6267334.1 hypothetical protein [Marivirga aurantiaca]
MDSKQKGDIGENAVNEIAFNTYLKYWCYPNPKDELGNKKEICDLLILFRKTLIIFSIKNYSFEGNYARYFNNTLKKAISQVQGAERKLLGSRIISIKHPNKPLEEINPSTIDEVQRVIVNLNMRPVFYPGGLMTSKGKYTHVLNWFSFLRLVRELDTIPDFIEYLKERENTFFNKELLMLTGTGDQYDIDTNEQMYSHAKKFDEAKSFVLLSGNELDLLADYYFNERKFSKHFYRGNQSGIGIDIEGKWEDYLSRKEVQLKKADDRYSYFVDKFVSNEVLYRTNFSNLELATELLAMSRFERRILGKNFYEFSDKYKNEDSEFIARRYGKFNDMIIGLMLYSSSMTREEALTPLQLALLGYSHWEGYKTKKIVMIGFSNKRTGFIFGYTADMHPLDKKEENDLILDLKKIDWFQNMEPSIFTIDEYPQE